MDPSTGMAPPPGGDVDKTPALLAVFWAEFAVATIFLMTRAVVRTLNRNWWWDDYTMVVTWATYALVIGLCTQLARFGLGRHMFYLSPEQLAEVTKWNWISQAPGIISLAMTKVTITLLLIRLMGPNSVWLKWCLIGNCALFCIICALAAIFSYVQCDPPYALWENVPDAKCWNPSVQADFATFTSAYAVFCDFVLALAPISIIWPLKLSVQKKLALCFVLGLGILAGICAAIKASKSRELGIRSDVTWASFDLYAWSASELFLNVVCGCVPACKPVFDKMVYGKPIRTWQRSDAADGEASYRLALKSPGTVTSAAVSNRSGW